MIVDTPEYRRFCERLLREQDIPYEKALWIFDALHEEAVSLGVVNCETVLEGLETTLRIARAINRVTG